MKKKISILIIIGLLLGFSKPVRGEELASRQLKLNKYLDYLSSQEGFRGEIVIKKGPLTLAHRTYGNQKNSNYLIGSISKQFLGLSILRLAREGRLDLDQTIDFYFKDYSQGSKISIRNLLNHNSGIRDFTEYKNIRLDRLGSFKSYIENNIFTSPLSFKPGSRYDYSNSNYYLLSLILEELTGQELEAYLKENIFEEAGMKNTGAIKSGVAINESGPMLGLDTGMEKTLIAQVKGAGYLYSNSQDLLRYLDNFEEIIGRDNLAYILDRGYMMNRTTSYSFGFKIKDSLLGKRIYHNGNTLGFTSNISYYREKDIKILVLSNLGNYNIDRLLNNLERILAGKSIKYARQNIDPAIEGSYKFHNLPLLRIYRKKNNYYINIMELRELRLFKMDAAHLSCPNSNFTIKPIYNKGQEVDKIFISPYNIRLLKKK